MMQIYNTPSNLPFVGFKSSAVQVTPKKTSPIAADSVEGQTTAGVRSGGNFSKKMATVLASAVASTSLFLGGCVESKIETKAPAFTDEIASKAVKYAGSGNSRDFFTCAVESVRGKEVPVVSIQRDSGRLEKKLRSREKIMTYNHNPKDSKDSKRNLDDCSKLVAAVNKEIRESITPTNQVSFAVELNEDLERQIRGKVLDGFINEAKAKFPNSLDRVVGNISSTESQQRIKKAQNEAVQKATKIPLNFEFRRDLGFNTHSKGTRGLVGYSENNSFAFTMPNLEGGETFIGRSENQPQVTVQLSTPQPLNKK
jgi:hypothetical protein